MSKKPDEGDLVRIPGDPIDADERDLAEPARKLALSLGLIRADEGNDPGPLMAAIMPNPPGQSVIEANATALAKWWATFLSAVGLVGGTFTVDQLKDVWAELGAPVRVAAVGGLALVIASLIIAVSLLLRADLRTRSEGTVAQYNARAALTVELMRLSVHARTGREPHCDQDLALAVAITGGAPPDPPPGSSTDTPPDMPPPGSRMDAPLGTTPFRGSNLLG